MHNSVLENPPVKLASNLLLPVLLVLVWFHASSAQVNEFAVDAIQYTGGRYDNSPIPYRIYIPDTTTASPHRSLFVWLHGVGEVGDDNRAQLAELYAIMGLDRHEAFPDFVVALQCPSDNSSWFQSAATVEEGISNGEAVNQTDEMITVLRAIIAKTIREHPIDPDRIYLVGLCSGGTACWEFAMRYPDLFAAMSTLADQGRFDWRSKRILDLPIWSFHSTGDRPEGLRRAIRRMQELGGNCHLTEIPSNYHDCWTSAFSDYDLRQWLLAQRRGKTDAPPPGAMTWGSRWKVLRRDFLCMDFVLGSLFVPTVAILSVTACLGEFRRRWRTNQSLRVENEAT